MHGSPPGSSDQLPWVQKGHVGGSSLNAAAPGPPRPYPTPPARARRVPGARRLPAGGATSRARPAPLATLRPVVRCLRSSPGEPPPSRHTSHRCGSPSAEPALWDWGAAAGSARSPRPGREVGCGGDMPRLPGPGPRARAAALPGESRSARGTRAGWGRGWAPVSSGPHDIRGRLGCSRPGRGAWSWRQESVGSEDRPRLSGITGRPGERFSLRSALRSDRAPREQGCCSCISTRGFGFIIDIC